MVDASRVQDILVPLHLALGPVLVHRASVLGDAGEDAHNTEESDGLLVDHIEFIADGRDGQTGRGGESGRLGDQAVSRDRVENRLGLLLRVFGRDIGVGADRGEVAGDGEEVAGGQSRPHPGGTWRVSGTDIIGGIKRVETYPGRSEPNEKPLCRQESFKGEREKSGGGEVVVFSP